MRIEKERRKSDMMKKICVEGKGLDKRSEEKQRGSEGERKGNFEKYCLDCPNPKTSCYFKAISWFSTINLVSSLRISHFFFLKKKKKKKMKQNKRGSR